MINASEKTFQIPVCYILAKKGFTVVHLTRHCGMEHGKDIIAIDPAGIPCAYQLKKADIGKIKLKQWKEELYPQLMQLVTSPISHPSVPHTASHHKSYFVTNGELEEEVFREIQTFNLDWEQKGFPQYKINTILKGEIIGEIQKLKTDFVPTEVTEFKLILEFYQEEGNWNLNKDKFSSLIQGHFAKPVKNNNQYARIISSGALLSSLAISNFQNKENHVAVIESWVIYTAYLFRFCELNKIKKKYWENEWNIARLIITSTLKNLLEELNDREFYFEGNVFEDIHVYHARITWLSGFLCCLGLFNFFDDKEENDESILFINKFIQENESTFICWGESSLPCFLSLYWFEKIFGSAEERKGVLRKLLLSTIKNVLEPNSVYPGPYLNIDEALALHFERDPKVLYAKNDKGISHYLRSIIDLLVREDERELLNKFWKSITRINWTEFSTDAPEDYYLWRCENGKSITNVPPSIQSWKALKEDQSNFQESAIPKLIREIPYFFPLFLMVFPHRITPTVTRWFDNILNAKL